MHFSNPVLTSLHPVNSQVSLGRGISLDASSLLTGPAARKALPLCDLKVTLSRSPSVVNSPFKFSETRGFRLCDKCAYLITGSGLDISGF